MVQDLKHHLVFVHKLDSCCSKFEELIKDPSTIIRHVGVKSVSLSEADASYANTKMIRKFLQYSLAQLSEGHIYDFEIKSMSSSEDDRPYEDILACSSVDLFRAIPSIDVSSDEPIGLHIQCLIQNQDLLN